MKHSEVIERSAQWLRGQLRCSVVLTEMTAYTRSRETPDVIGWVGGKSILIEAKLNKAGVRSDMSKAARKPGAHALGSWRFFVTPQCSAAAEDVPDGWGLYQIMGGKMVHVHGMKYQNAGRPPFESDIVSENAMLVSALRRRTAEVEDKAATKLRVDRGLSIRLQERADLLDVDISEVVRRAIRTWGKNRVIADGSAPAATRNDSTVITLKLNEFTLFWGGIQLKSIITWALDRTETQATPLDLEDVEVEYVK